MVEITRHWRGKSSLCTSVNFTREILHQFYITPMQRSHRKFFFILRSVSLSWKSEYSFPAYRSAASTKINFIVLEWQELINILDKNTLISFRRDRSLALQILYINCDYSFASVRNDVAIVRISTKSKDLFVTVSLSVLVNLTAESFGCSQGLLWQLKEFDQEKLCLFVVISSERR